MKGFEAARDEILEWVAQAIQVSVERIDLKKPLADIGIDSLDAVHMIATIESIIRHELPEHLIGRIRCLEDIFELMRDRMAAA